ncbi:hypothetical protein [Nonomuraea sp. NPDC049750]|uniref:hypothetical protein n=1 Tax=Nonomuraea sp. NPDC049750 TaxID=3154738 RepID=UPI0033FF2C77
MSDWETFMDEVTWFVQPGESVVVGEARRWTRGSIDGLPELSALFGSAALTPVSVDGTDYELLAWGSPNDRRGWFCHTPFDAEGDFVPRVHKSFWRVCGGIIERFGEPDTWWNNQNQVLTLDAARVRIADVFAAYTWLWEDAGLEVPIDPDEYYAVAVEANGNLTVAHRSNGRLVLFAPDHAFTHVTPLAGSPPYSLLTMDKVPDLATWIEVCAAAWRDQ